MKLLLITLLCCVAATLATNLENFAHYQKHFNKEYKSKTEVAQRAATFQANVDKINAHNERFLKGQETYTKEINQFTDMTEKEFLEYIRGNGCYES